jgi:hypothetical protein
LVFLKTKKWVRKSVAISLSLFSVVFTMKEKKEKGCGAASSGGLQGLGHTIGKKSGRQLPPRASSSPFNNNTT